MASGLWLVPTTLAAITTALLVVSASGWPRWLNDRLAGHPLVQPTAGYTAATVLALWIAGLLAYAWPRRHQQRPWAVIVATGAAGTAAVVGFFARVPCGLNGDVILTPLWDTLTMFLGSTPQPLDSGPCRGPVPLAIQLARFLAIVAVFTAAGTVAVHVLSRQLARLRIRYRAVTDVVIGADQETLPLVQALRSGGTGHARSVAVLLPGAADADLQRVEGPGATVIAIPRSDFSASSQAGAAELAPSIRPVLTLRGTFRTKRVWLMDPDPASALQHKDALEVVLASAPPRDVVRVFVRCNSVDLASRWRSSWVSRGRVEVGGQHLVFDALSATEITAIEIVGHLFRLHPAIDRQDDWHLIICGDTDLAAALGVQLAIRCWESQLLAEAWKEHVQACENERCGGHSAELLNIDPSDLLTGGKPPTSVTLMAPAAQEILRAIEHGLSGAVAEVWRSLQPSATPTDWDSVSAFANAKADTEVIVTQPVADHDMHTVERLVALSPQILRVWANSTHRKPAQVSGVSNIEVFNPSVLLAGDLPEGSWTRIARLSHEAYRRRHFKPDDRRRWPWWHGSDDASLDMAIRQDNIHAIRTLMENVADRGYMWTMQGSRNPAWPSGPDLDALARAEHARWLAGQRRRGQHAHDFDRAWKDLSEEAKVHNVDFVRDTLSLLSDYGYQLAGKYERVGWAIATYLDEDREWKTATGDLLVGRAGDWFVTDRDGRNARTVMTGAFDTTYRQVREDLYERVGRVAARQATEPELVRTEEGTARAEPGMWIITDADARSWPVTDEAFRAGYVAVMDQ